jgi:hypothetical protein
MAKPIVTYVPKDFFSSPTMSVNIWTKIVIVNYQGSPGQWQQVFRSKKENELVNSVCFEANPQFNNVRYSLT